MKKNESKFAVILYTKQCLIFKIKLLKFQYFNKYMII